jgi:hypothetical protein
MMPIAQPASLMSLLLCGEEGPSPGVGNDLPVIGGRVKR